MSLAAPATERPLALGVLFVYGLLGGAHCLGMCGPLVTVYGERMAGDDALTWHHIRQHALFNLGRTAGYATVGAVLGALGAALYGAGTALSVGRPLRGVVGVVVGLAIVAVGVGYLRGGTGATLRGSAPSVLGGGADTDRERALAPLAAVDRLATRVTGALTARIDDRADGPGIAALGALHALLPCPILYPAFLFAFALGSPLGGGLALAAMGAGTIPALFLYGTALSAVDVGSRRRLHRALGAVVVLAATVPLTRGLAALGVPVPTVPLPMPAFPGAETVVGGFPGVGAETVVVGLQEVRP